MTLFMLTFSKEICVTVEAESEEMLRKVAKETAHHEIDNYWDTGEWEVSIDMDSQIQWLISTGKLPTDYKPECILFNNKIIDYKDYLNEKEKT